MQQLATYIENQFGLHAVVHPASKEEIDRLPLYLKGNYNLFTGNIEGRPVLWAEVLEESEATPDRLEKQGAELKELFRKHVIFIFDHLDSWQRKRFIEKKVAFIQLFKQLYVPEMLMELSDVLNKDKRLKEIKEFLSYPSQCALLYHLQKESLAGRTFGEIARILNYSAMTVTRMAKELAGSDLAKVEGGNEKYLSFNQKGKELWGRAFPFFATPVKEIWFCDENHLRKHLLESGDAALAEYSMLSPSDKTSYAIGKEEFRSLKRSGKSPQLDKKHGDFKIEVWNYNPLLLSEPGSKVVDRLSLYLSFQSQDDERILAALKELINTIEW